MPQTAVEALERLGALGSTEAAAFAARYCKTGPGQYGEGDVFLGIRVPVLRKLAVETDRCPRARYCPCSVQSMTRPGSSHS